MQTFLAVADRGSFAEAARVLRISPAAATRAVAKLEEDLGLSLFNRTTRVVRLTERGALYTERCRQILADLEATRNLVRGQDAEPRGQISVTAPVLFGRLHILPIAEALTADYPDLQFRLTFLDRVINLVEEGFDLAVRIGALHDSSLIGVNVADVRRVVVASPSYLADAGEPRTPAELRQHAIIAFEGIGSTNDWRFSARGETGVTVHPRISLNSAAAAIDCARRGNGIIRALSYQVQDAIAAGELLPVLQDHEPVPIPVSLLYQANRRGSPNVQAFVAAAKRYFASTQLGW